MRTERVPSFGNDNHVSGAAVGGDQFVTFSLTDEVYGIDVLKVREIIGFRKITKLPNVSRYVKGVLNLRGIIVPVIDLRLKFSMEEKEYDRFTVIIIVEVRDRIMGIVVDAVTDVVTIKTQDIQATPEFSTKIKTELLEGLGKIEDNLIILLDVDKVLSDEELDQVESAVN